MGMDSSWFDGLDLAYMESSLFHWMDGYDEGLFDASYSRVRALQRPLDEGFYDSDVDCYWPSRRLRWSLDEDFYNYDVNYSRAHALAAPLDEAFYDCEVEYSPARTLEAPLDEIFYDYDVDYSPAHAFEGPLYNVFYYCDVDYSRARTIDLSLDEVLYNLQGHNFECNASTGSVDRNPNSNSVSTTLVTAGASMLSSLGISNAHQSPAMGLTAAAVLNQVRFKFCLFDKGFIL